VKVKFLHYAGTMQESCLRLMGKKLLVSLAMEGKFSSEGLQAINDEDDILMAMARELVTEKGIGERADAVWATLQKQQKDILGTRSKEDLEAVADQTVAAIPLIEPDSTQVDQWSALKSPLESLGLRNSPPSTSTTPGEQLTLF
jgi:hypothetical protein